MTTALLGLQLTAGLTSAGNVTSKDVLIGSGTSSTTIQDPGPAGSGSALLTFTPVSAGQDTFFNVWVKNNGGQTLNNITLMVGGDQVTSDGSNAVVENGRPITADSPIPLFPDAFPSGITVLSKTVTPSSVSCTQPTVAGSDPAVVDPAGAITCAIGQLAKGKSVKLEVLLRTATGVVSPAYLKATVRVAENANDSGTASNQDTFAAEGTLVANAASCEGISGFLPAGQEKKLGTSGLCTDYQTLGLDIPSGATTTSTTLSIATRDGSDPSLACASGYTCFGDIFDVSVNGGATLANGSYMTVSVVFNNVPDEYTNVNKMAVIHDGVVITTQNKDKCGTKKVNNCWTGTPTLVVGPLAGVDDSTFSITLQLTKNGFIRGG